MVKVNVFNVQNINIKIKKVQLNVQNVLINIIQIHLVNVRYVLINIVQRHVMNPQESVRRV